MDRKESPIGPVHGSGSSRRDSLELADSVKNKPACLSLDKSSASFHPGPLNAAFQKRRNELITEIWKLHWMLFDSFTRSASANVYY